MRVRCIDNQSALGCSLTVGKIYPVTTGPLPVYPASPDDGQFVHVRNDRGKSAAYYAYRFEPVRETTVAPQEVDPWS